MVNRVIGTGMRSLGGGYPPLSAPRYTGTLGGDNPPPDNFGAGLRITVELFHPASSSEPEVLLMSEDIEEPPPNDPLIFTPTSGVVSYMRPIALRIRLLNGDITSINSMLVSLVYRRLDTWLRRPDGSLPGSQDSPK